MEIGQIIPHVEALIFTADHPLPATEVVEMLNNAMAFLEDRVNQEQVQTAIDAICEKYNSDFYAFEVRQSGGGYQFLTKPGYQQTVAQLNGDKFLKKLSTAALETLAIIAYKQPVSKGEVEVIRGVNSDYSVQKLLEKELIMISGRSEELPGKPLLYATSRSFMDYFGINSPEDLPKIKEIFTEELVIPTSMDIPARAEEEEAESMREVDGKMVVLETGELTVSEAEEAEGMDQDETKKEDPPGTDAEAAEDDAS